MVLIRGFEDLIQSLFLRGEIYGTTHLYSGQEAVAVGMASVLEERDRVAATYRGHGHALALGVDPQELLDEMLGRATGVNGGRAGSMNINSPSDRLVGSFGIVGGTIAAATGVGLALKRVGGVAVCQFGDGAINQGYFYECLNFCAVLRLPVVFLCENNGYGEYTPFQDVTAGSIRARAEAMEVPAETVDGMSVVAVRAAAGRAVAHARAGGGPCFLEAITYRYVGHSRSDPGAYRPPGELDAWKERDPIPRLRGELVDAGVDPAAVDADRRRASQTQLADMERRGLEAPFPEPRPTRGVQRVSQNVLRMPRLSDSMSEATIVGWLKRPGETFLRGEPLVEVETDKATVVYEAEADGLLAEILVPEGGVAALGEPIARLAGGDGDDASPRQSLVPRPPSTRRERPSPPPRRLRRSPSRRRARGRRRWRAGPRSRSASRSPGSTARARAAASASWTWCAPDRRRRPRRPATLDLKGPTTVVALSTTGQTIARRMTQSRSEIPSFDVVMQADMSAIVPAPPRRRRPRGDGSVGERLRRQGRGAGAAGVPRVQQLVRRRAERAPRPGERRHRGGHGGCAAGARGRRRGHASRSPSSRPRRASSPRGRATGDSRPRSSRRRRSRSRTWACSACARSPR